MFDAIADIFFDVLRVDSFTLGLLITMVCGAALLINAAVDSKMYTSLFIPGMVSGAFLALWAAREWGFSLASHKDANHILLIFCGLTLGFAFTLVTLRCWQWIQEQRQPTAHEMRDDLRA